MWQDGGGGGGGCDTTSLTCAADDASGNQWLMDMVMLSCKRWNKCNWSFEFFY